MSTIFCSYIVALLISRLYVYASPVSLEPVGLAAPNFPTFKRSEEFNDIDDSSLDQLFSQSATFEPDPQNDTINSQETVTASPITLLVDPQDENIAQSIFDSDNQPHTMTIENASDDPNLSNIYCTTDIPEKSAVTLIQKRDLTAKNPDNACPVRPMNFIPPGTYSNPGNPTRPSLKPQPPPPVVDQQTSSDADRCIKSPAFAGAEERYTVHVSCGGPKVGDFPSDPDFVLNCTPGRPFFVSQDSPRLILSISSF